MWHCYGGRFADSLIRKKSSYFTTWKFSPQTDPPAAILVVGGATPTVELVDFTDGGAESCVSPVTAINYYRNAAGILVDGKPTICGGGSNYNYYSTDKCISYDLAEGKWLPYTSLPEPRYHFLLSALMSSGKITYQNWRFSGATVLGPNNEWWITGGQEYPYDYYPQETSVKLVDGQWRSGPMVK